MDNGNAIGQLGAHAVPVLTTFAAVILALLGITRWRRRLRVNAEYAAALALIRAPYTVREALSSCRSHLIESGETPPGWCTAPQKLDNRPTTWGVFYEQAQRAI